VFQNFNHPICAPTDTSLFTIFIILNITVYYGRSKHNGYEAIKALVAACQGRKIVIPLKVLLCFKAEGQFFTQ
jgi:hypothetical protein